MKLETTMREGCVHTLGECVDEDAVELWQAEMLVHDVMRAHALMLAMESVWDGELDIFRPAIGMVEKRADKIMRGWVFDAGEAE